MNKKTYLALRMTTAFLLAVIVSVCITEKNYIIPFFAVVAALVVLTTAKRKVNAVLEDERDYFLAGNASRYALFVYCIFGSVASIVLLAMRDANPNFELAGSLLAYSACGLLILQGLIFNIMKNKNYVGTKNDNED
jgi:uncharacterized membrane protein